MSKILNNLDQNLSKVLIPWAFRHPSYIFTFKRLARSYKKTVELRKQAEINDLKIPPFLILSVTKQCNLSCAGCYAAAVGTTNCDNTNQLNSTDWRKVITEANELGVFGYIIAGGEPFLYPKVLDFCKEFNDRIFVIVTNGTAISKSDFKQLKKLKNVAVIVSLEGGKEETNSRRGKGVYEKALKTIENLKKTGIITGISVTVNKLNIKYWISPDNIDSFVKKGVKVAFFIEQIPTKPLVESSLILSKKEQELFREKVLDYREHKRIYIIHSPGDEELLGGCVSAGKGFAHVTPTGDLTPCPVSNIATHNLKKSSLREGLASPLFKIIRESAHLLETEGVPCALFAHQNELQTLANLVGGFRNN